MKTKYAAMWRQGWNPAARFSKAGMMVFVGLAASCIVWACCQMNGTVLGCNGTRNTLVFCGLTPHPVFEICTVESPGSEYPDATGGNDSGTMDASPRVGICTATARATGVCCGGSVTQVGVVGFYGYAECTGEECPRP